MRLRLDKNPVKQSKKGGIIIQGEKILIIDDDTEFVASTATLLESRGYEIDSAPNGKEGLEKAKTFKPHLVLLDVMMTTRSEGFDISRELSKDERLKSIPVIVVTGIREKMNLPFGFEPNETWLPVKVVLEKPITPEQLLTEIEK
ncbi:response regulator, partial [candidate division WOR-3 bacterium]|nr:response regulator [candidate division WOR-3 bacterium]